MTWTLDHIVVISIALMIVAVPAIFGIFWTLHRIFRGSPLAAALSGSVANIVLGVVLGVWLNNLFALRRGRGGRGLGLRQQHLARLQPIVGEVSVAVLDKCMGHGSGLRLIVNEGGFNYIAHGGGSVGGSGKPSQDIVAAFSAFKSFRPSADLLKTCATLAQHADQLATRAQQLSTEAKALAEQTTLEGSCQFVRLNQND